MPFILLFLFSFILFSDSFVKTLYGNTALWVEIFSFLPDRLLPTTGLMDTPILQLVIAGTVALLGLSLYVFARMNTVWWYALVTGIWCILIVFPMFNEVRLRNEIGLHTHGHDGGVIQTIEAIKSVYRGENPYSADYSNSPMKQWGDPNAWVEMGYPEGNPALTHVPYSPLSFLIHVPFDLLARLFEVAYDPRFLYMVAIFGAACISVFVIDNPELKRTSFVVLLLNPIVPLLTGYGMNDSIVIFFLMCMVFGLVKKKRVLTVVSLALALSIKIICIFLVPFVFALYLFQDKHNFNFKSLTTWVAKNRKLLFVGVGIILAVYGPFVAWNAGDLYDDIIAFNNGTSTISYPIRGDGGYGIGSLVLYLGLVDSVREYFPFWILQLAAGFVVIGIYVQKFKNEPTILSALVGGLILLSIELYLSRFWHKNYFVYPLILGWMAYAISPSRHDKIGSI